LQSHINKLQETVDQMRSLDKAPVKAKINLRKALEQIAEQSIAGRQEERAIEVILDAELEQTDTYVDPQHFEIIMRNLFENSLRATEEKAFEKLEEGEDFAEQIEISVYEIRGTTVVLEVEDNGIGLRPEIADRLYRAKCSTQAGRDHGQGGLMIARLLELNGGGIEIVESIWEGRHSKTRQRIRIPLALVDQ
jgi:signal transduction histidine kinase